MNALDPIASGSHHRILLDLEPVTIAERHLATLVENVRRFAAGEPLLNVVNKRAWY